MEDFVTYEQAVKLKELGFNWTCNHYYDAEMYDFVEKMFIMNVDDYLNPDVADYDNHNAHQSRISAPTIAQAQKWFREVHKMEVWVVMEFDALQPKGTWVVEVRKFDAEFGDDIDEPGFSTYEQALSEGITVALNLLKEKQ